MPGKRKVAPLPAYEEKVLEAIATLTSACVDGIDMLLEELEDQDPDPDERCGLLAMRHEIFALRVPGCRRTGLVVSIDRGEPEPASCTVHGLAQASALPCSLAYRMAREQLGLVNSIWEPAS